ncbi:cardiolipin synthase [Paenibacillus sp. HN-1]|uniref:cardiolipin synthase n=1 Tax=Paenibacillus TaxID=44249 RepID=UPI001CA9457A|nr:MULTISPECIES: cardiolipin synthase [Paenibacillus]MBY9081271.1 cardiolipin synthase [Paenibacillus sp. CGMCC 1.18879]MBY9087544.1 cardiolipin synthase [Paenibacillus sinensis]
MVILAVLLAVFIIQGMVVLLLEYRRPQRAVAWLCMLFFCPPLVLLIYYALGRDYASRRRLRDAAPANSGVRLGCLATEKCRPITDPEETANPELYERSDLLHLLRELSGCSATARNHTEVLIDGQETYDSMLKAMESAAEHIHLEVYILRDDEIGRAFRDCLCRKARQGVKVRLLIDGLGSHALDRRFIVSLRSCGVETHVFLRPLPALRSGRFNYRNHRKILVVDGKVGFTGGINIGDEYLGKDPKLGYWRDTQLRVEGDAVFLLQRIFLRDWQLASGERLNHPRHFPAHCCIGEEGVQIIASGPDGDRDSLHTMLFAALNAAQRRFWLETPYFIPDPAIRVALKNAVLRGVDVRIIIPATHDRELVYSASLSYMGDLLEDGVRFYRYRKGFLHAKMWIADSMLSSIGTGNLDLRSFYANFEVSAVLMHPTRIEELAEIFRRDLENSDPVDTEWYYSKGKMEHLREEICRVFSPLL